MGDELETLFGERIRQLRQLRGWTQEELARYLSNAGHPMRQATVAKLENATRPTNVAEIGALAALLDVPIGSLFGEADRLQHQMELNALAYQMKSLTAEANSLSQQREEIARRAVELDHELTKAIQAYETAEKEFEAKFGTTKKGEN